MVYSNIDIQTVIVLEVIHIISKSREAFPGAHEFHKIYNRSRELENPVSPAREELHWKFHGGSSNGLAQVTCHNNEKINFRKLIFDVADPIIDQVFTGSMSLLSCKSLIIIIIINPRH